uniref:Ribosomal protein L33 n=1 Tax=Hedyotis longiramulis TaxID=2843166 RepID=A0A8K1H2A9_9GENT|nr:ribosomal protein L33 [Hedyotis sp. YDX-2021]
MAKGKDVPVTAILEYNSCVRKSVILWDIRGVIYRDITQQNWCTAANRLELCAYCYKHTIPEAIKK